MMQTGISLAIFLVANLVKDALICNVECGIQKRIRYMKDKVNFRTEGEQYTI